MEPGWKGRHSVGGELIFFIIIIFSFLLLLFFFFLAGKLFTVASLVSNRVQTNNYMGRRSASSRKGGIPR